MKRWGLDLPPPTFNEMVSLTETARSAYADRAVSFFQEIIMGTATLIGIDLGKHYFFLHAQDRHGHEVWRKKATRTQLLTVLANCPASTVAMEACAGAHWLARKLQAFGHQVRLIAPQFVRPFVKGNKTDFADAEAICEAAARPAMRFVALKTPEQQTLLALHRVREALVAERTATANQIHGFLLEFGVSLPVGTLAITRLPALLDSPAVTLPPRLISLLLRLHRRYGLLSEEIAQLDSELKRQLDEDEAGRRLLTIPGIGPITASCLLAMAGDMHGFKRGRDFAASLGLVPRQHSTGGRPTLLGITKRGDKHLRSLLVQGARAVMQRAPRRTDALGIWLRSLMQRRHSNVVACALANKMARIVWAILAKGGEYRAHPATA